MAGRYGGDIRGRGRRRRKPRQEARWFLPKPPGRVRGAAGTIIAAYGMYMVSLAGLLLLGS